MGTGTKKTQVKVGVQVVLGMQVRRLRIEANLTQQVLAEQSGIFRTYLSRIEGGTANPTVVVLAALATSLNVEIVELFKGA
jgi:transcriptional regulator with XRE-family HTH domain